MKKFLMISAGVAVVAVAAGAGVYAARDRGPAKTIAIVREVTAGDTLTVDLDGKSRTLHLADVEAPSEADGDCLALESTEQLSGYAPVGTKLRLESDGAALDASTAGDTIDAAAYLSDGSLLNGMIAGDGLAYLPATASSNPTRFDVQRAQETARVDKVGLYSVDVSCTIPAQVFTLSEQVETAPLTIDPAAPPATLTAQRARLATVMDAATQTANVISGDQTGAAWEALRSSDRISYVAEAERAVARLEVASGQITAALGGSPTLPVAKN